MKRFFSPPPVWNVRQYDTLTDNPVKLEDTRLVLDTWATFDWETREDCIYMGQLLWLYIELYSHNFGWGLFQDSDNRTSFISGVTTRWRHDKSTPMPTSMIRMGHALSLTYGDGKKQSSGSFIVQKPLNITSAIQEKSNNETPIAWAFVSNSFVNWWEDQACSLDGILRYRTATSMSSRLGLCVKIIVQFFKTFEWDIADEHPRALRRAPDVFIAIFSRPLYMSSSRNQGLAWYPRNMPKLAPRMAFCWFGEMLLRDKPVVGGS